MLAGAPEPALAESVSTLLSSSGVWDIWKYFRALVRLTGVSARIGHGCQTTLLFSNIDEVIVKVIVEVIADVVVQVMVKERVEIRVKFTVVVFVIVIVDGIVEALVKVIVGIIVEVIIKDIFMGIVDVTV